MATPTSTDLLFAETGRIAQISKSYHISVAQSIVSCAEGHRGEGSYRQGQGAFMRLADGSRSRGIILCERGVSMWWLDIVCLGISVLLDIVDFMYF